MKYTCKFCGKKFDGWGKYNRFYCSLDCRKDALDKEYEHTANERFWDKVEKSTNSDGCWIWQSAKTRRGYGRFWYKRRYIVATHAALLFGKNVIVPNNMMVCHHCDNPECVNPDHLFIGTHYDNMQDCKRKGRTALGDKNVARKHPESRVRGDDHWTRKFPERRLTGDRNPSRIDPSIMPRGSNHYKSQFTEKQVMWIYETLDSGNKTQSELAKLFNVSLCTINSIYKGRNWKHTYAMWMKSKEGAN